MSGEAGNAPELVNSATVAEWLGCSDRRVRQLVDENILTATKAGKFYRFDLRESVRAYIAYMREGQKSDEQRTDEERKLAAEADYKETKLAQERLKLAELENNMHRSEDVQDAMEQLVYSIRSMLVALPGRLAVDVAGADSAAEASALIRNEVNQIMDELVGFNYSPEFFAKRVNEREGWRGDGPDAETAD